MDQKRRDVGIACYYINHISQGAIAVPWDFGGESRPPVYLDHGEPREQ